MAASSEGSPQYCAILSHFDLIADRDLDCRQQKSAQRSWPFKFVLYHDDILLRRMHFGRKRGNPILIIESTLLTDQSYSTMKCDVSQSSRLFLGTKMQGSGNTGQVTGSSLFASSGVCSYPTFWSFEDEFGRYLCSTGHATRLVLNSWLRIIVAIFGSRTHVVVPLANFEAGHL